MIYKLCYDKMSDDFIELPVSAFEDIFLPCMSSEFQRISTKPLSIITCDDSGGDVFPDFIYDNAVPLFSEKLFEQMTKAGTDHLFRVKVTVTDEIDDITKTYILGLPPRINVLDEYGHISEEKAGSYSIFKSSDMSDHSIYITYQMRRAIDNVDHRGLEYLKI